MVLTNNKKGNFGLRKTDAAKDCISKLPDEVLVSILSLLELKEAAKTSVLSNRWRYLWTFTRTLDFSNFFKGRPADLMEFLTVSRPRFPAFVNKVLNYHRGPTIDNLTIGFDLDESDWPNIENWVKFALERRVKRLSLDFSWSYQRMHLCQYPLTTQFLRNYSLDSIKALFLRSVNVSEEVLNHLLSHCRSLETLHMASSQHSLVNLKFSGPSLSLKHLEIWCCRVSESIEISDIHLVSFKYVGHLNVHFKNVPHLDKLSLNGPGAFFLLQNSGQFSTLLSKLEMLELYLIFNQEESFPKFPKLRNLRKLNLTLEFHNRLLPQISLITMLLEVSPLLHTLALEFQCCLLPGQKKLIKVQKANLPHQCLKVFKLSRLRGSEADIVVAKNILNVAVSLEKLIIDTSSRYPKETLAATTLARQLEEVLPSGAKLVIL